MATQSEKQLAGNQRRTLRAMRKRLLAMADEWEELDEFNRGEMTRLADLAEEIAISMIEESA